MKRQRLTWRECGYCSGTTRKAYCNGTCTYHAQGLRHAERGLRPRDAARTSAWEEAAYEYRLRLARRMVLAGCDTDMALDEAGFLLEESSSNDGPAYRALRRRLAGEVRA